MSIAAMLLGTALVLLVLAYVLHPILKADRGGTGKIGGKAQSDGATGGVCPGCGVRPEPDAVFCSRCGRPIDVA
jgi:hypothetical protein